MVEKIPNIYIKEKPRAIPEKELKPPGRTTRTARQGMLKEGNRSPRKGTGKGKNACTKVNSVLRIRDILVRIRIWIRGSLSLTNGCGSGSSSRSCYFHQWPSSWALKNGFFSSFLLLLFKLHFHHFPKKKVMKKSQSQNSRNQGFLTIYAW